MNAFIIDYEKSKVNWDMIMRKTLSAKRQGFEFENFALVLRITGNICVPQASSSYLIVRL